MKDVLCNERVAKGEMFYTRCVGLQIGIEKKNKNRPECGCEIEINISRYANE